jgi:hypothetical protein
MFPSSAHSAGSWKVVPTHFGRIEDLRTDNTTNKNTDQLGYTNAAVDLHTDQPFIASPPRFQCVDPSCPAHTRMLQCIRPATVGGESTVCDVRAVAAELAARDGPAFELLSTVPVRFHRVQKSFESLHMAPILQLDAAGQFAMVRSSYFTMDPHVSTPATIFSLDLLQGLLHVIRVLL